MAEDGIGNCQMKIEVRLREMEQIVCALECLLIRTKEKVISRSSIPSIFLESTISTVGL